MTPPGQSATAEAVPVTHEPVDDVRLLDHGYDGIREYDNPLPGWWKSIFVGTIIFAGFYGLYFQVVGWGHTSAESYSASLATYASKRALRAPGGPMVTEEMLARGASDSDLLSHGADVFAAKCKPCHAADGRGQIGPNLTDLYQLHGSTRMDLYNTVYGGAPGTQMIAWSEQLPPTDILAAATYVCTLRGTNVPGGKPPQGKPVGPYK